MAEVILGRTSTPRSDAIADYISLDNPEAALRLVQKIFEHDNPNQASFGINVDPDART